MEFVIAGFVGVVSAYVFSYIAEKAILGVAYADEIRKSMENLIKK